MTAPLSMTNCTSEDLSSILFLYQNARALQLEKKMVIWPKFSTKFILNEIHQAVQFKITNHQIMLCNWVVSFSDPDIWGELDKNDSVFIHRICTHPDYRGQRFIDNVVLWAKTYTQLNNKKWVPLDTLGNNQKLIDHYTSAGFNFIGMVTLENTGALPEHYRNEPHCCRFELIV